MGNLVSASVNNPQTVVIFRQVAGWMVGWVVDYLSSEGVKSPSDLQSQTGYCMFQQFEKKCSTKQLVISQKNAEGYIKEYYEKEGFHENDIEQLLSQVRNVQSINADTQVFKFSKHGLGTYKSFYVAMNKQGGTLHMIITCCEYTFALGANGLFGIREKRTLTTEETTLLQKFFLYDALQNITQTISIPAEKIPLAFRQCSPA